MTNALRPFLIWLGITGAVLFGVAFVTSILNPHFVGQTAKAAVRYHVEAKIDHKIDALDSKFLSGQATRIFAGYGKQAEALRAFASSGEIGKFLVSMGDLSCECREKIESMLTEFSLIEIASLEAAQEKLTMLIRTKYLEVEAQLTREFRIFTAADAVVFLLLAVVALLGRRGTQYLLAPALILLVAASVTAYFYLFNQNWLSTIVVNDYLGYGYVSYLAIVFALLLDVLLNRARITWIIGDIVTMPFRAAPC